MRAARSRRCLGRWGSGSRIWATGCARAGWTAGARGARHDRAGRAGAVRRQVTQLCMARDLLKQTDYAKYWAHQIRNPSRHHRLRPNKPTARNTGHTTPACEPTCDTPNTTPSTSPQPLPLDIGAWRNSTAHGGLGNRVEQAYVRQADVLDQRRDVMEDWAAFVTFAWPGGGGASARCAGAGCHPRLGRASWHRGCRRERWLAAPSGCWALGHGAAASQHDVVRRTAGSRLQKRAALFEM